MNELCLGTKNEKITPTYGVNVVGGIGSLDGEGVML